MYSGSYNQPLGDDYKKCNQYMDNEVTRPTEAQKQSGIKIRNDFSW